MSKLNEVINRLAQLEEQHGGRELNIYNSFGEKTIAVDIDQIYYDDKLKDVYIGIYN